MTQPVTTAAIPYALKQGVKAKTSTPVVNAKDAPAHKAAQAAITKAHKK